MAKTVVQIQFRLQSGGGQFSKVNVDNISIWSSPFSICKNFRGRGYMSLRPASNSTSSQISTSGFKTCWLQNLFHDGSFLDLHVRKLTLACWWSQVVYVYFSRILTPATRTEKDLLRRNIAKQAFKKNHAHHANLVHVVNASNLEFGSSSDSKCKSRTYEHLDISFCEHLELFCMSIIWKWKFQEGDF